MGLNDSSKLGSTAEVTMGTVLSDPDISSAIALKHVQNTDAYLSTQVTHTLHVDVFRTDSYTATGSITKPFKTIQEAIDHVASVAVPSQDWSIQINAGQYRENLVFENTNLYMISLVGVGGVVGIVPAAGNAIQSVANNSNLSKFKMTNIEITQPIVITGSNGSTAFSDVWIQDCKFSINATITLDCINNFSLMSPYIETAISLTNVNWFYVDSGRLNSTFSMTCDSTLPAPSWGVTGASFFNGVYLLGDVSLTKGDTATGAFIGIGSRISGASGTIVNPAGWTFQAYNSFIRGNFTNNGTLQQRNSYIEKVLTNNGTWTLDNFCSQIKNDSTVIGTTVKDALETIRAGIATFNPQTGTTYQLDLSDAGKTITFTNSSPITVTVPTDAVAPFAIGTRIDLIQNGSGKVTLTAPGVVLKSKGSNKSIGGQYVAVSLLKESTNTWYLIGDLIA